MSSNIDPRDLEPLENWKIWVMTRGSINRQRWRDQGFSEDQIRAFLERLEDIFQRRRRIPDPAPETPRDLSSNTGV